MNVSPRWWLWEIAVITCNVSLRYRPDVHWSGCLCVVLLCCADHQTHASASSGLRDEAPMDFFDLQTFSTSH